MGRRYLYLYSSFLLGLLLTLNFIRAVRLLAQEEYPSQPEPTPSLVAPYPGSPAEQGIATAVPAPIGATDPPTDNAAAPGPSLDVQPINPQANLGRYYLWGGFLAATLILATTIYGAITLFVRRKE